MLAHDMEDVIDDDRGESRSRDFIGRIIWGACIAAVAANVLILVGAATTQQDAILSDTKTKLEAATAAIANDFQTDYRLAAASLAEIQSTGPGVGQAKLLGILSEATGIDGEIDGIAIYGDKGLVVGAGRVPPLETRPGLIFPDRPATFGRAFFDQASAGWALPLWSVKDGYTYVYSIGIDQLANRSGMFINGVAGNIELMSTAAEGLFVGSMNGAKAELRLDAKLLGLINARAAATAPVAFQSDGAVRAVRSLDELSAHVVLSVEKDSVLAGWRKQTSFSLFAGAIFSALLAFGAHTLTRALGRRFEAEEAKALVAQRGVRVHEGLMQLIKASTRHEDPLSDLLRRTTVEDGESEVGEFDGVAAFVRRSLPHLMTGAMAQRVGVWRLDMDGRLVPVDGVDYPGGAFGTVNLAETMFDQHGHEEEQQVLVFKDARAEGVSEEISGGCRSMVLAPLVVDGRMLGLLAMGRWGEGEWEEEEINFTAAGAAILANFMESEARHRAELEARAESRARAAYLANMSHELRTPLTAIIGFAEMLEHEANQRSARRRSKPEMGDHAKDIVSSGRHLLNLIDDILDASRIVSGHFEIKEEIVGLDGLVADAVRGMAPLATKKDIGLIVETQPAAVVVDPVRLKQVVINLLSNALKFTPEGGNVRITSGVDNGSVPWLQVSDSGPGMPQCMVDYAFRPFRRLMRSGGPESSSGLGLAIVKEIVRAHGAEIEITTGIGKGFTAKVKLPETRLLKASFDPALAF